MTTPPLSQPSNVTKERGHEVTDLPAEATRFAVPLQFAPADAGEDAGARKRKLAGVAYSGDVVKDHPFWPAVIFDLSTTKAPEKVPVLVQHDPSQRAGFCRLAITDKIEIADGELLDNELGRQIAAEADAGFPWQQSVHIVPDRIEHVEAGYSVTVNGRTVNGPVHVFRNSRIRETSLTPVGADHRTSAQVFSASGAVPTPKEEPPVSDTAALEARIAALETENTTLKATNATLEGNAKTAAENARFTAITVLYGELGREAPKRDDAAITPYLSMTEEQFAAVAADLRKAKPKIPAGAFQHTVTGDQGGNGGGNAAYDPKDAVQFAAAITQRVADAAAKGRKLSVTQAAAELRAERESA